MTDTLALAPARLLALPHAALGALRGALLRDVGGNYATYLQEAAYAGGETVFDAFRGWLAAQGAGAPESLGLERFRALAPAFFAEVGWGHVSVHDLGPVVAVDSDDWAEADPAAQLPWPGCYYGTGLLADFFSRIADAPLAAMEVECRSAGAPRCRWLLGSQEVMGALYEGIAAGEGYEAVLGRMG